MFRRCVLALVVTAAVLPVIDATSSDGPKGKKPAVRRPHLPGHRIYLTRRHGIHRVDYRVTAWQNVPAANRQAAQQIAKHYRSNGWSAQIAQPSKGVFVVKARMSRWRLATYSAHSRTAHAVAGLLRSQGYQARVRY
jgi:hypothetical protein